MQLNLLRMTPSSFAGLGFALVAFWLIPQLASSLWLNVFTSTACFALAAAGVAFMYARLGMFRNQGKSLYGSDNTDTRTH